MSAMEVTFNVLDNISNDDEDDTNFLAVIALRTIEDLLIATSMIKEVIAKDNDDDGYDKLLNTYNELLSKHIKSKK